LGSPQTLRKFPGDNTELKGKLVRGGDQEGCTEGYTPDTYEGHANANWGGGNSGSGGRSMLGKNRGSLETT